MGKRVKLDEKRFEMPGRYIVTLECANDLTPAEIIILEAWFETVVGQLQKKEECTYTDEEAIRWQTEAAGIAE